MTAAPRPTPTTGDVTDLEIELLLEGLFRHRGFDLRAFDAAYLRRRIERLLEAEDLGTISALQGRVLRDPEAMDRLLRSLLSEDAALFFQPGFFSTFGRRVVGRLTSQPRVQIWVAGCCDTADAFSLAILLAESPLKCDARLYATGMHEGEVLMAKAGIVPLEMVRRRASDYRRAGGRRSLTDYYTIGRRQVRMKRALNARIVWAQHNLVTDASFNQFHCIICRNTFDRFGRALQERVIGLLYDSLTIGGVLGFGGAYTVPSALSASCFAPMDRCEGWFVKTG